MEVFLFFSLDSSCVEGIFTGGIIIIAGEKSYLNVAYDYSYVGFSFYIFQGIVDDAALPDSMQLNASRV